MAESTFDQTGVDALRALYAQCPDRVTSICARAAASAAAAMVLEARRRLLSPSPATKGPHVHTPGETMADAVEIVPDLEHHEIRVVSNAPSQYPANLTIWTEHGTSRQPARPYMRPAAEAVRAQFDSEIADGIDRLTRELSS